MLSRAFVPKIISFLPTKKNNSLEAIKKSVTNRDILIYRSFMEIHQRELSSKPHKMKRKCLQETDV